MQGDLTNNLFLLVLILLALAAAWFLGWRSRGRNAGDGDVRNLSRDYFIGLNYLLNDEPDDAIDTFINALEINSSTVETHMALGTLLRRRGKVDKSIVVYQSILARPRLGENEVNRVKVELIRSYIAAGLLDRAERLLDELQNAGMDIKRAALALAINLYQLEKDWDKAVSASDEMLKICPPRERPRYQLMASHFYCELAREELDQNQYNPARQLLKRASQFDRGNVRAYLLAGQVEMGQESYRDAIKVLIKVKQQDPEFESETIIPLLECYRQIGSERHLNKFIRNSLEGDPSASVLLGICSFIQSQSGHNEAVNFIIEHLRKKSSLRLMNRALALMSREGDNSVQQNLLLFHNILEEYLNTLAMYRCENCGFEAKNLHWLCPGCSEWGMIRPVKGILGE